MNKYINIISIKITSKIYLNLLYLKKDNSIILESKLLRIELYSIIIEYYYKKRSYKDI